MAATKYKNIPVHEDTFTSLESKKINCESWDSLMNRLMKG